MSHRSLAALPEAPVSEGGAEGFIKRNTFPLFLLGGFKVRQQQDCWESCGWAKGQGQRRYHWVSVLSEHQPGPLPHPYPCDSHQTTVRSNGSCHIHDHSLMLPEGEEAILSPDPLHSLCRKARKGAPILQMKKWSSKRTEGTELWLQSSREWSWSQVSQHSMLTPAGG